MDGRLRKAAIAATRERPLPPMRFGPREVSHSLLACVIGLNFGDVVTTRAVLQRGGGESNPVMQGIVDSTAHASLVKFVLLAIVIALVLRTRAYNRIAWILTVVTIWYTTVVLWNLSLLASLSGAQ
jgi:hypothetical protein